jgi:hypothetical protein
MSNKPEKPSEPDFAQIFSNSVVNWGGWHKLVTNRGGIFVEPLTETISAVVKHQREHPARIGTLSSDEWNPIASTFGVFLNAFLQQELHRILDGPRDIMTVLRLVDDNLTAQLLLALVIIARELHLDVEVSCKDPHDSRGGNHI